MTRPEIIAHRGAAFDAPENSLEAFDLAISQGADRLEFDVRSAADGAVIVHHDPTTERCGDRELAVRSNTLDHLRNVRLANGESVPTLAEVCELAGTRAALDIEIKPRSPSLAASVLETVRDLGFEDRTIITSFHREVVRACRDAGFTGRVGLLVGSKSLSPAQRLFEAWPLTAMRQCGADALAIHHRLIHPPLARRLRQDHHALYLWMSIEDEEKPAEERARSYERMLRYEPTGMIVGRVAEARRLLQTDGR